MAEETKKEEQDVPEVQETQAAPKPKHIGFGRYEYDGQRFNSKEEALAYIDRKRAEQEDEEEFGAILPEGYDMTIVDRPYIYRNSLMELAMNERFAPDGSFNKYYDREWVWGWAALSKSGTDISGKQAKGYRLVDLATIKKLVKEDKIPAHIPSMLREEGSYLVYGDSVLMRMPRVLRRQQQREKFENVMRSMKNLDRKQKEYFKEQGVGVSDKNDSGGNELNIRF